MYIPSLPRIGVWSWRWLECFVPRPFSRRPRKWIGLAPRCSQSGMVNDSTLSEFLFEPGDHNDRGSQHWFWPPCKSMTYYRERKECNWVCGDTWVPMYALGLRNPSMKLALMYSSLKSSPPPPALLMVEATPLFKILVLLPRSLTRVWSSGRGWEKLVTKFQVISKLGDSTEPKPDFFLFLAE